MKEQIPVNPEMLVWARKTAGLSLGETAKRLNKTVEVIDLWEKGVGAPTYLQLEKLAYNIYKRPLALFFFPEPPQEETPKQSFRTLPEQEIEMIPSRVRILIRKARVMQANLVELNEGINPAEKQISRELKFDVNQSMNEIAMRIRAFLGISLDQQIEWKNTDEAFKGWRERFEENGIFVFKDAFKEDDFSGFCLYDDAFPLIYINNSMADTRQIFTLFHELAHLLFKTGGIDTLRNDYLNHLEGENRKIEVICNRFTGVFLVPDSDFKNQSEGVTANDGILQDLADRYKVSREVILRKFFDKGMISHEFYSEKKNEWMLTEPRKGKGGDYYRNMGGNLSQKYMDLAFGHFYQNRITDSQLAEYLGVKAKSLPGMENIMMSKGTYA